MTKPMLQRRWGGDTELREMLEEQPGGQALAERDFALVTVAGQLAASFPGQLIFKGGFVLRHAHGHLRFSKDVDATRHDPPKNKFVAAEVADAISGASIQNVVHFSPGEPATDSGRSLDFDNVRVSGELLTDTTVQVEVSYREEVIAEPVTARIGAPFYEEFEILTMDISEMTAEKLRALAQRTRATDLADLAVMLDAGGADPATVAKFADVKFELVKAGRGNRVERIKAHIDELSHSYDDVVPALFPGAPNYRNAASIVLQQLQILLP